MTALPLSDERIEQIAKSCIDQSRTLVSSGSLPEWGFYESELLAFARAVLAAAAPQPNSVHLAATEQPPVTDSAEIGGEHGALSTALAVGRFG